MPGISLIQKNTNTTKIRVHWESMATPSKIYEYDIITKEKKLVKETEIPSGHNPKKYVVERVKAKSHDGRMIPISLVRLKNAKQDGKSKFYFMHTVRINTVSHHHSVHQDFALLIGELLLPSLI